MTTRRVFLKCLGATLLWPACRSSSAEPPPAPESPRKRPNFVIFLTDDQAQSEMACMGNSVIRTPNMDRLAGAGALFTNSFVTTAICCSSRASILTGQYMRRHGIRDFGTPLSSQAWEQTYPALLRKAGYRTGYLGKFAIGSPARADPRLCLPADEFDSWYGFPQELSFEQTVDGKKRYLTSLITEKAIHFLRENPVATPFCLVVAFKEPHGPHDYFDPEVPDPYVGTEIPPPANMTRRSFEALPEFLRKGRNATAASDWRQDPSSYQRDMRTWYRYVTRADLTIGEIMAEVKELGLDADTVVVHTSDNPSIQGAHGLKGKWLMYEESIRVPLIIRDPRVAEGRRGLRCTEMALNIDLAPTVLSMAGVPIPPGMQGMDLQPFLHDPEARGREDWYYEHVYNPERGAPIPESEGVRTRRWKYIRYTGTNPPYEQLFDLATDSHEESDLARDPAHAQQISALRTRCDEYRRTLR